MGFRSVVGEMMRLKALHCDSVISYREIDQDSARCRIGVSTLQQFCPQGRIGSIVKIQLYSETGTPVTCLCTLWPDTRSALEESCICISPVVTLSSNSCSNWMELDCEVL